MDCPLNIGPKKYFFRLLEFIISKISPIKGVPGKSSRVNNF